MIHDLILLERPLISLDLETTGVYPTRDKIIQIGMVRVQPDGQVQEKMILLDPGMPIPEASTKVHKITDTHVQGKKKFYEIAASLANVFAQSDLCGYNLGFDLGFLREEFKRCNLKFTHGKIIDGYKIFANQEQRTLTAAMTFFLNETHPEAHDALGDAKAALRVIEAQLMRYNHLPRSIEKLHDMFFAVEKETGFIDREGKFKWYQGEVICNFGKKHFGRALKEIVAKDRKFLEWIMGANFQPDTKKIAADALQNKFPKQE